MKLGKRAKKASSPQSTAIVESDVKKKDLYQRRIGDDFRKLIQSISISTSMPLLTAR